MIMTVISSKFLELPFRRRRGDELDEVEDKRVVVFEVYQPGNSSSAVRHHGGSRKCMRSRDVSLLLLATSLLKSAMRGN